MVDCKPYEGLAIKKGIYAEDINGALSIVRKYVIREKRILKGGMGIHFALLMKGDKLYEKDAIPDYDWISHEHAKEAYDLTVWLVRAGYKNVSCINGIHSTTMKVRVGFSEVADISYMPKEIIDVIPTLQYRDLTIVHPHYQMIDQHDSLSKGYSNAPLETILFRWDKDMKRYDLLYKYYPLRVINVRSESVKLRKEAWVDLNFLKGQCIGGFVALNYWLAFAKKRGFKLPQELSKYSLGSTRIENNKCFYIVPDDSTGMDLITENISELEKKISQKFPQLSTKYYEQFMDTIGFMMNFDNKFTVRDIENSLIAAHKIDNIHIVNLQFIMKFILSSYVVRQKLDKMKRKFSYYIAYLVARKLVKFGIDNDIPELCPTEEFYGSKNSSNAYILQTIFAEYKKRKLPRPNLQPKQLFQENVRKGQDLPDKFKFDYNSMLFRCSGKEITRDEFYQLMEQWTPEFYIKDKGLNEK